MEAKTKEHSEYPEIEGAQYVCQQDEVITVRNEANEPEDNYVTRSLYIKSDDSTCFIKTRQWRPWWNSEPADMGDEGLPTAQAALQWAVNVAGLNPTVAARLIVGTDTDE